MSNKVYVLNKYGHPLMPCSPAKARNLLNNKKATQTQILLAQNGLLSAQNSLNSSLNTEISAQANVDKARNQLEKSTNAVTTAELNLQNAIDFRGKMVYDVQRTPLFCVGDMKQEIGS